MFDTIGSLCVVSHMENGTRSFFEVQKALEVNRYSTYKYFICLNKEIYIVYDCKTDG